MELYLVVNNRTGQIIMETKIELPFIPRKGDSLYILDAPDDKWLKESNAEIATVTGVNYNPFDYKEWCITVFALEDK